MKNLVLGLAACVVFSGLAKGEVVYNNLNAGGGTARAFTASDGDLYMAQKFSLSQSTTSLDWIKLNLFQSNSSSTTTFTVKIYNDSSNSPFTIAANLTPSSVNVNSLGSSSTDTWSIGGGINLSTTLNVGSYWIVVQASQSDADFKWAQGPSNPSGSASADSNNGTFWTTPDSNYNFGGQIAVPEPGTLLLGTLAACSGAAGAWWKRRKRKATQPETTDQPATA